MKNLFKSFILIFALSFTSCELTELDYLDNPNAVTPDNAEISLFFNQIQLDFGNFFMNTSQLTAPVVRMRAMTGGNTYNNAFGATTFNFAYNTAYANLFPDIDQLISIAENPENPLPQYAGAGKVLKAYVMMVMVDLFGDIPFSEAGQGVTVKSPNADSGSSIYEAALALLDSGISDFSAATVSIGANDMFYGGDFDSWTALANTLKLRYHVTTRLSGGSGSAINSLGSLITSADQDFAFQFSSERANPNSRHWDYNNHYEVDGGAYLSNYYMWSMVAEKGMVDPRTRYYFYRQNLDPDGQDAFTLDCNGVPRPLHYTGDYPWCTLGNDLGGYWGRDHGNNDGIPPDGDKKTCFGLYPAGGKFDSGEGTAVKNGGTDGATGAGIGPIMLSSYTHFMLAEAALMMGTGGDARQLLEDGVRQSIAKVMSFGALDAGADASLFPSADDVDAYVDIVLGNYDAAASDMDKLDVVLKEYHIALWGNGQEAYNFYRRTGLPSGLQPTREADSGDFPRLMFYPADYVNLNANATQRDISQQVFWDTNPAGFIN